MNEEEYYASEFSDTELDSVADGGEFFLEESGFYYLPTQAEMQFLVNEGNGLLLDEKRASLKVQWMLEQIDRRLLTGNE
jgi:hypothetical protein